MAYTVAAGVRGAALAVVLIACGACVSVSERTPDPIASCEREHDAALAAAPAHLPQARDPWYVDAGRNLEAAQARRPLPGPARNVIVFIGDGMDPNTDDVLVYASGPLAHLVQGVIEQNYLFHVAAAAVKVTEHAGT